MPETLSPRRFLLTLLRPDGGGGTPPPLALVLIRGVAGAGLMFHGWKKIQDPFGWMGADSGTPAILQALAALSEFGGGLAWILGLLTPLASFGILATMAVAASRHISRGDPFVGRGGSYELALLYLVIAVGLLLGGPGRWSLDALLFRRRRPDSG